MKTFRILSTAALLTASVGVQAGSFSYDYLEGSFGEIDEADVIYVGGAKSLDKQFGLIGSVGFADFGSLDGMILRGGGLFHTPIQKDLDFVASVELVYVDYDIDDDIGLAAAGGVRYAIQDNFQLEGKITITEVDPFEDGLGLLLNARYYMNKQLSADVGVASDAEFDGLFLGVRYDFK